jgi:predicted transcriptional regulator
MSSQESARQILAKLDSVRGKIVKSDAASEIVVAAHAVSDFLIEQVKTRGRSRG